jgi:hypothetical protein
MQISLAQDLAETLGFGPECPKLGEEVRVVHPALDRQPDPGDLLELDVSQAAEQLT